MTNIEIAVKLINVMDPSSVTDEAIKQAVLALLAEAEPKATPKPKAAADPKETKKKKLDHGKICALPSPMKWDPQTEPSAITCRKRVWSSNAT